MAIERDAELESPHGKKQPMVKFCPTCKNDVEVIHSNQSRKSHGHESHNYWCVVCDRIFEINYMGRGRVDDSEWTKSVQ